MDLEARIRSKQALEAQFLEIMKQARSVTDALEVQRQLSEVRGEIERLEGRRRFLENQSSLSTITVTLQPSQPLVNTSGFFYKVKRAFGSGVDIAASITLFLVQFIVAIIPVVVLIFLPIWLLLRYLLRRLRRARLNQKLAQEAESVTGA
jgi:Flp pilus assembly protein TadB